MNAGSKLLTDLPLVGMPQRKELSCTFAEGRRHCFVFEHSTRYEVQKPSRFDLNGFRRAR